MAKKPVRVVRRTNAATAPINQSRGAGAAAPASAAATAPPPGRFYDPAGADDAPAPANPLRGLEQVHHAEVQAQAIPVDEVSTADVHIAAALDPDAPADETLEQAIARISTLRKPLGSFTQKLALPKRAGYHSHWFNDEGGRIDDALNNGWAHRRKDGVPIKRAVGRGRDQGVLYAYAMDLPEVFWLEDMAQRHKDAASKIQSLKESPFRGAPGQKIDKADKGKFYDPVESDAGPLAIEKG